MGHLIAGHVLGRAWGYSIHLTFSETEGQFPTQLGKAQARTRLQGS